jgi:predicted metalloendopeptidase
MQVLGAFNSSVKPCDDYFEYSCGGWLQAHPLPRHKAFWDVQAHQEFIGKLSQKNN